LTKYLQRALKSVGDHERQLETWKHELSKLKMRVKQNEEAYKESEKLMSSLEAKSSQSVEGKFSGIDTKKAIVNLSTKMETTEAETLAAKMRIEVLQRNIQGLSAALVKQKSEF